jgi:hypothetical protein
VVGVGVNAIKIGVLYRWGILRQKSSRSGGGDWVRFGGGFKGGEGEKEEGDEDEKGTNRNGGLGFGEKNIIGIASFEGRW